MKEDVELWLKLTLLEGILKSFEVVHAAHQVFIFVVAAYIHHFKFLASRYVLLKLGLGCSVLAILEVDDVKDICPWAFVAVYALSLAVAGTAVYCWKSFRFDGLE